MKKLALVLAIATFAGCEAKKEADKPASPSTAGEGSGAMPRPTHDDGAAKPPGNPEKPKVVRKVVDPAKKGQIATYKCGCTGNLWTQPAEEEKLCVDDCGGKMAECGTLVKIEPATK